MPEDEAKEWLEMLGVTDGGLESLVRATYKTLGLQTYFTTGTDAVRCGVDGMGAAWRGLGFSGFGLRFRGYISS